MFMENQRWSFYTYITREPNVIATSQGLDKANPKTTFLLFASEVFRISKDHHTLLSVNDILIHLHMQGTLENKTNE